MIFFNILIFVRLWTSSCGNFQWFASPQDVHVEVGKTAFFPCNFTGSSRLPYWTINDALYYVEEIPPRHIYGNKTLYVRNVTTSDNLTRYQCEIYSAELIISTTGILHVIEAVPTSVSMEDNIRSNTSLCGSTNVSTNNQIVYGVVAGAVFLSITILCTGIIIIMAVLVYRYKTFHHRSPHVGYPSNALSELDAVRYDGTVLRSNEAYDTGPKKPDPLYAEVKA